MSERRTVTQPESPYFMRSSQLNRIFVLDVTKMALLIAVLIVVAILYAQAVNTANREALTVSREAHSIQTLAGRDKALRVVLHELNTASQQRQLLISQQEKFFSLVCVSITSQPVASRTSPKEAKIIHDLRNLPLCRIKP